MKINKETFPVLNTQNYITSAFGRVCRKSDRGTTYFNFPIQATCADILKIAFCLFQKNQGIQNIHKDVAVRAVAHDEIVFECPTHILKAIRTKVVQMMEEANCSPPNKNIGLHIESGIGPTWADKP